MKVSSDDDKVFIGSKLGKLMERYKEIKDVQEIDVSGIK